VLPQTFFTKLAQVFEAEPAIWDATSWTHAGDCLNCEWRVDGEGGGVWGMECGKTPQVISMDSVRKASSSSQVVSREDRSGSSVRWRLCFLQLDADVFLDIISGNKNANQAVFDSTMKVAGDIESLPLLNIALAKMKEYGATIE
jgi:hypothetical protein